MLLSLFALSDDAIRYICTASAVVGVAICLAIDSLFKFIKNKRGN